MKNHLTTQLVVLSILFLGFSILLAGQNYDVNDFAKAKEARMNKETVISSKLHLLVAQDESRNNKNISSAITAIELTSSIDESKILKDDRGAVGISMRVDDINNILPELVQLNVSITGMSKKHKMIEGFILIGNVMQLEELRTFGLKSTSLIYKPNLRIGSVTSQADQSLGAANIRAVHPERDGRGVKVGTMSDSYDNLAGEADGILSGDLPNDVIVIEDLPMGGSDEGRALCELVHDLAPGADLYFATAGLGQISFADNIQTLADSGCTVIVDDVGYFAEPFFQDGIIAQKIDEVAEQNVAYFSAAGNMSDNSYESTVVNMIAPPISTVGGMADYDFDPDVGEDVFQKYVLQPGESIALSLQWDDPFFTVDGVDTDLDLFLFDDPPVNVLANSSNDNVLTQTPVEILIHTNGSGVAQTVNVLISKFAGPDPGRVKYVNFANTHNPQEFDTQSPTIVGHPAAEGAIAVAAAFFANNVTEPFSSIGPATIIFDPSGNLNRGANTSKKLFDGPVTRQKPDITGPDGTNTTFFGADILFDDDNFPNFFGTSAAAPHSAAMAALFIGLYPNATIGELVSFMNEAATDIMDQGLDDDSGFGGISLENGGMMDNAIFADGFESGDAIAWSDNIPRPTKAGGPNNDIRTIIARIRVSSDRQEDRDLIFKSGNTLDLRPNFEVHEGRVFELHVIDLDFENN